MKICGLRDAAMLDVAVGAGASHVGFVCFAPSPRHLGPDALAGLAATAPRACTRVAVVVDADDALLAAVAPAVDVLQLHGREIPARVADVRARFGKPVWKAAGVRTAADVRALVRDFAGADALLFDAKAPEEAPMPGGNGLRFDWRALAEVALPSRWVLSGGLDAATVADAVRLTGARAVDVSSGVEDAPGVKSAAKIRDFVKAAHG